ncbi:hypothetical protein [Marinibactrum halimedae]|uniref:Uncharacterized protein n=1 Tax=Marinibactrum halimedae TaxID=1444977 RepID=A0AA37T8T5_9GAMM|nr:hypothetical protein [Marinibactrum halimedae]MCD9459101.1 hypothetical protein [Marinibactrum halimedae]GLS24702.1 hypothetical protein GCM10007877_04160 [Marinibactrum halimedae]
MTSSAVSKISHLARALYLQDGNPVILSMRPPTFATHVETDANRGAFYTFRIYLSPPNIKEIINKRIERIFLSPEPISISDPRSGFILSVANRKEAIQRVNHHILNIAHQDLILRGLSNNNVRRALLCFQCFLRFPDLDFRTLFDVTLASRHDSKSDDRKHSWSEHFLKGLMLSGHRYFRSSRRSVVSNILFLESNEFGLSYTILYRVLSACYWSKGLVKKYSVFEWFSNLYAESHVKKAMEMLLDTRLLTSPEHEYKVRDISHVSISEAGNYYLEQLIKEQTYLYEAIFDIPLHHKGWNEESKEDFHQRTNSILEYLHALVEAEELECTIIEKSRFREKLSGIFRHSGLLCHRIHSLALRIGNNGKRSKNKRIKEVAESFCIQLEDINHKIKQIEKTLRSYGSESIGHLLQQNEQKSHTWNLGSKGQFVFKHPPILLPESNNLLHAELLLKLPHEPEVIMVHLMADNETNKIPCRAMWPLKKQPYQSKYMGEIALSNIKESQTLPTSSLTVFADSRALFTKQVTP